MKDSCGFCDNHFCGYCYQHQKRTDVLSAKCKDFKEFQLKRR